MQPNASLGFFLYIHCPLKENLCAINVALNQDLEQLDEVVVKDQTIQVLFLECLQKYLEL